MADREQSLIKNGDKVVIAGSFPESIAAFLLATHKHPIDLGAQVSPEEADALIEEYGPSGPLVFKDAEEWARGLLPHYTIGFMSSDLEAVTKLVLKSRNYVAHEGYVDDIANLEEAYSLLSPYFEVDEAVLRNSIAKASLSEHSREDGFDFARIHLAPVHKVTSQAWRSYVLEAFGGAIAKARQGKSDETLQPGAALAEVAYLLENLKGTDRTKFENKVIDTITGGGITYGANVPDEFNPFQAVMEYTQDLPITQLSRRIALDGALKKGPSTSFVVRTLASQFDDADGQDLVAFITEHPAFKEYNPIFRVRALAEWLRSDGLSEAQSLAIAKYVTVKYAACELTSSDEKYLRKAPLNDAEKLAINLDGQMAAQFIYTLGDRTPAEDAKPGTLGQVMKPGPALDYILEGFRTTHLERICRSRLVSWEDANDLIKRNAEDIAAAINKAPAKNRPGEESAEPIDAVEALLLIPHRGAIFIAADVLPRNADLVAQQTIAVVAGRDGLGHAG
ncbi:MAG TPA: hypothetical protein PKB15_04045 [Acidimicrobiia bacterium]|mgnify:CR=1 FL=1|nr:hypothetical protein [Acidimicrobiia bacterium]